MSNLSSARGGWIGIALMGLALTSVGGCGSTKTYPVRGKVIFPDGTPLTGGVVVFEPVDPAADVSARGNIQPDGTFRLGTYQDVDGALEGRHRALVVPPLPPNPDEKHPPKPLIHPRFRDSRTSGLEFTVGRDKDKNDFTIVVARP